MLLQLNPGICVRLCVQAGRQWLGQGVGWSAVLLTGVVLEESALWGSWGSISSVQSLLMWIQRSGH